MSSLQSQVRKIERVLVKQRAIIGAHLYADTIIDRWQATLTSDNPNPDILAFMAQIPGPEVHLPTEAAVIGYLEKCRRKGAAPVRSALLTILIPGMASAGSNSGSEVPSRFRYHMTPHDELSSPKIIA